METTRRDREESTIISPADGRDRPHKARIAVAQERCTGCRVCTELCIVGVFTSSNGRVEAAALDECWQCGHCVAGCPVDAIEHSAYPVEDCPLAGAFPHVSVDDLVGVFRRRRSVREFLDRSVPRSLMCELLDLGRWVPSAKNTQPVDWIAFDDPGRIADLSARTVAALAVDTAGETSDGTGTDRLVREHMRGEDPIFYRAPVVLVAHVPFLDSFGRDHAAYAAHNLMLAAGQMGLGSCLIGYVNAAIRRSPPLAKLLGVPRGRQTAVVIALGYPVHRFHRVIARRLSVVTWNPPAVQGTAGTQ